MYPSVIKILESLLMDSENPIDPNMVYKFDHLVELLRQSSDLSILGEDVPAKCWTSESCIDETFKMKEVHRQ